MNTNVAIVDSPFRIQKHLTRDDVQSKPLWVPPKFFAFGATNAATHIQFNCSVTPASDSLFRLGDPTIGWSAAHASIFFATTISRPMLRKKIYILAAHSGLEHIESHQVIDFTWKADGKSDTGLIAPQARQVNLAFYRESVDMIGDIAQYPHIISLIKSVQELSERLNVFENAAVHLCI